MRQSGEQLVALIQTYLAVQGLHISRGIIVDAVSISAPSATMNRQKERDPKMHQPKKGAPWYFGMKACSGVDSQMKPIHSMAATAANVHDRQVWPARRHGHETRDGGDARIVGTATSSCRLRSTPRVSFRPKRIGIGR
mgnify:CR=1 FL=1